MARAAAPKFIRNSAGIHDFLTSDPGVIALIVKKTEDTAGAYEAQGEVAADGTPIPVETHYGVTDRFVGTVVAAHPAALPIEAKRGALSKATAAAGLEWGRKNGGLLYMTKSGNVRTATAAQRAHWTRGKKS